MRKFKLMSAGPAGKNTKGGVDFGLSMIFADTIVMKGRNQSYQVNMLLNTKMETEDVVASLRMLADHIEKNVVNEPAFGKLKLALVGKE